MNTGSEAEETTEAIMHATYQALCEHGYSELTISKIAAEFEKSKGLLYYHYEDKDELLTDFLRYLLEEVESKTTAEHHEDAAEHLFSLFDRFLPDSVDDEQLNFQQAYIEIRSQAPYKPTFQRLIHRTDDLVLADIQRTIERGVDAGQFRDVDPESTAEFLLSSLYGAMGRSAVLEYREPIARTRRELVRYVERHLLDDSE